MDKAFYIEEKKERAAFFNDSPFFYICNLFSNHHFVEDSHLHQLPMSVSDTIDG